MCSSTGRAVPEPCPEGALRDLEYGLLGPEATSITYIGADGTRNTQTTSGPDGGYLIVRPHTTPRCVRPHGGGGLLCGSAGSFGPRLRAGVITTVTYRTGQICHLPEPAAAGIVGHPSCPLVGYQSPPFRHVTPAQLAAPVTVYVLPAEHYCNSTGPNIPGCKQVGITITFTARVGASNPNRYYEGIISSSHRAEHGVSPACGHPHRDRVPVGELEVTRRRQRLPDSRSPAR